MNESTNANPNDFLHELWLIYTQLKDAESKSDQRLELLECSREQLGKVLNRLYRQFHLIPDFDTDQTKFAPVGKPPD
jgi:hypothetical protein